MLLRSIAILASLFALVACTSQGAPSTPASSRSDASVALTYLGTAGWQVTDGAHVMLVDPYFSRIDVQDGNKPISPDERLIAQYAPARADGILVGHSHYDHLLDAPVIARKTGAMLVGTESTLNVARATGVDEARLRLAHGGESFQIGPFSVRAIRALHSLIGMPSTAIPRDVTLPMAADAYAEGGTLQYLVQVEGRRILFIGTANFIEGELEGIRPNVAVVAVGLREKIPDYSCRLMRALGRPGLVLTNHFDAHWEPLGPKQMNLGEKARASLAAFAGEVHACAPETKVVVPTHLQPIPI